MIARKNPMLAYWDSYAGLIPCRVEGEAPPGVSWPESAPGYSVVIRVTARRGSYERGDCFTVHPRHVWPRDCVGSRRGTYGQRKNVARYHWRERIKESGS
jgi:hypothetical protein